ncbi:Chloride channel protein C [Diplonema papillatum]|nr:Chloride channel protein C [Diplonema papillatum]
MIGEAHGNGRNGSGGPQPALVRNGSVKIPRGMPQFDKLSAADASAASGSEGELDDDISQVILSIAALNPDARQQVKHYMAMYEQHDYRQLQDRAMHSHGANPAVVRLAKWKEDLKATLEKSKDEYEHALDSAAAYQSLNYAGADDHIISREHQIMFSSRTRLRAISIWIVFIIIGCATGCTAYVVKILEAWLGHERLHAMEDEVLKGNLWMAFTKNWGYSMAFVTIAVLLTVSAPGAAGSGVPDVKALLNGVRMQGTLRLRTFVVKVVGVALGVASGLAMGPEGPMIHAGAIIAAGVSQAMLGWPFRYALPFMRRFRNDRFKRDAVSAGAATGVAAAFGAPIGGLLFSMEEASSFWSHSQTWRTMITCIFGTFTMMLLVYGGDRFNDPGLVHFGVAERVPSRYEVWELLAWIPLGLMGGLSGAFFNAVSVRKIAFVNKLRAAWSKVCHGRLSRTVSFAIIVVVEAWVVTTIIHVISFELARTGMCKRTPLIDLVDSSGNLIGITDRCSDQEAHGVHFLAFDCDNVSLNLDYPGTQATSYNDLASLALIPQLDVIKSLLSRDVLPDGTPDLFSYRTLGLQWVAYFTFTVLTAGLYLPQGLFVPQIMIGALYGRLYGSLVHDYIGATAQPGTYALMGAASMLSGSTRITISLSVIMFEITNDIQYIVPLVLVIVIAKNVGQFFNEPYYDALLELRHIPVLEEEPPATMELFHVGDLMAIDPVCANRFATLWDLTCLIQDTGHSCFPVVRGKQDPTLLGSLSRESVHILIEAWNLTSVTETPGGCVFFEQGGVPMPALSYKEFMRLEDSLRTGHRSVDTSTVRQEMAEKLFVDILPYTNLSAFIVPPTFSLATAFTVFRTMGLRHLIIVNTAHAPIGILTRQELHKHFAYVWSKRSGKRLTYKSLGEYKPSDEAAPQPFSPFAMIGAQQSIHNIVEEELDGDFRQKEKSGERWRMNSTAARSHSLISNPHDPAMMDLAHGPYVNSSFRKGSLAVPGAAAGLAITSPRLHPLVPGLAKPPVTPPPSSRRASAPPTALYTPTETPTTPVDQPSEPPGEMRAGTPPQLDIIVTDCNNHESGLQSPKRGVSFGGESKPPSSTQ